MFPILQIGSLAIQVAGLMMIAGFGLAVWVAEHEAKRLQQNPDEVSYLVYLGLVVGLVVARLAYAVRFSSAYVADPLALLSPSAATLALPEGGVAAILAMVLYVYRRNLNWHLTLTALTPAWIVLAGALALAHLANGDAFGAAARLPWSIYLWEEYRHPSQVYELLVALGLGLLWWRWLRAQGGSTPFWWVVALWAGASLFLEAFRGDSYLWVGFRVAQFGYLVMWFVSWLFLRREYLTAQRHSVFSK